MVPEDVSNAKAAHGRQTPRPAGIPMVGGPHLDDDEGQNSGVLRERERDRDEGREGGKINTIKKTSTRSKRKSNATLSKTADFSGWNLEATDLSSLLLY